MADLRVENVKISEEFNAALLQLGVAMPIDHHPDEVGEVIDAMGNIVLQVDPLGSLPDDQASAIAAMIILAVNTCGSFLAVEPQEAVNG
jgi:hypothetical protein